MDIDTQPILGLVFIHPKTGGVYGEIRPAASGDAAIVNSFAVDDCGNAFVLNTDGSVTFWDHETEDTTLLAARWSEFVERCELPTPVELDEKQVASAWIDPDFAKEMGLNVPNDGWVKPPSNKKT
jgi:hypothetical protein